MLIKKADDKKAQVDALETLMQSSNDEKQKKRIAEELRIVRAGIRGEAEAGYLIDFQYANNNNWAVIHDLRIELPDGRTAQIDHLLIDRDACGYVLETKHFASGLKIEESGEFLRWNDWKKTYVGMPSPIAQNERHIMALKEAVKSIKSPVGHLAFIALDIKSHFRSYILVSPNARIIRPDHKRFDSSCVVKADQLSDAIQKRHDSPANLMRCESLYRFAENIASLHRPGTFDSAARFAMKDECAELKPAEPSVTAVVETAIAALAPSVAYDAFKCRSCQSETLSIQYGKYGYYFKCGSCDGNTPIRIGCGRDTHKERVRKDGSNFYRECTDCGTSSLFFSNSIP